MLKFNPLDVCRLCLASSESERLEELTQRIIFIISSCLSLKIHISSGLTNKICQVCVDQLENFYKYRKRIIKNELILLKKSMDNIGNDCLQDNCSVAEVKNEIGYHEHVDVIDMVDDDFSLKESIATSEIDRQEIDTRLEREENYTKLEKEVHQFSLEAKSNMKDINVGKEHFNNLSTVESDILENGFKKLLNKFDLKSSNVDEPKKPFHIGDKISLKEDEKHLSFICPITLKSRETLEAGKESTNTNYFNISENTSICSDFGGDTQVILNNEQYVNTERKFICLTCLKVFKSQKELSIHYKTVELSRAVKEASKNYNDLNHIKSLRNDDGTIGLKCGACSKVFINRAALLKHTQIHKVERPYQCSLCSRTYKTVADILRHGVVHDDLKFVCPFRCGYTTVHSGALREHVKRHKKEFKYKCEKCGKCFQVKTWYDQHQNVHDKVRPFVCKLCGQAFSMSRYLTAHQANVHPQSSKVKRFKCAHCALPCDSRKSLVMHMKQNHGMKTDCLCDVCGQIFADQQKLILHKNVHGATRRFSCRFCKKTFNKKDHKTVHEKIHTGERLNCNSCPKSFTQRCSLRRHVKRYHQGEQLSKEQIT